MRKTKFLFIMLLGVSFLTCKSDPPTHEHFEQYRQKQAEKEAQELQRQREKDHDARIAKAAKAEGLSVSAYKKECEEDTATDIAMIPKTIDQKRCDFAEGRTTYYVNGRLWFPEYLPTLRETWEPRRMIVPIFPEDKKGYFETTPVRFGKWVIKKYLDKDRYHIEASLIGYSVTVVSPLGSAPTIIIDRSINYAGGRPELQVTTYWGFGSVQTFMLVQGERTFKSSPVYLMRFNSDGSYFRTSSGETLMDGAKENLIFLLVNYDTLYFQRYHGNGEPKFYEVLKFDTSEFHSLIKNYPELWPEATEMEHASFMNHFPAPNAPRPFTSNDPAWFIVNEKIIKTQIYK